MCLSTVVNMYMDRIEVRKSESHRLQNEFLLYADVGGGVYPYTWYILYVLDR